MSPRAHFFLTLAYKPNLYYNGECSGLFTQDVEKFGIAGIEIDSEEARVDAQTAMSLFSKELLAYDSHVGKNDMFYYSLPYERNYALTTSIPIAPVSGNIIKFYQYRVDKPDMIFTDVVDTTAEELDTEEELLDETDEEFEGEYDEDGEPRELSEEEMAALLTEDSDEIYDKPPSGVADAEEYDDEVYDKEPAGAGDAEAWEAPEL